jgi:hypothetical protein
LKTIPWFLCIALGAGLVSAQSLAELAKKERERRERLPKSKVIRDGDLADAGGKTASMAGREIEEGDGDDSLEEKKRKDESKWDAVLAWCRRRLQRVKAVRAENTELFVEGLPVRTDGGRMPCSTILARGWYPGYVQHAFTCESLQKEIGEQDAQIKGIEEECLNEARKLGIPPGTARAGIYE